MNRNFLKMAAFAVALSTCFSCNPGEDECVDTLLMQLPDLFVQGANIVGSSGNVQPGQAVTFGINIINLVNQQLQCKQTKAANAAKYDFALRQSNQPITATNPGTEVARAKYAQSAMEAGAPFNDQQTGTPNVPGYYALVPLTDSESQVEERDEDNNGTTYGQNGVAGRMALPSNAIYFQVTSSPEFEKRMRERQPVEFFTFHDSPNLVSRQSAIFNDFK